MKFVIVSTPGDCLGQWSIPHGRMTQSGNHSFRNHECCVGMEVITMDSPLDTTILNEKCMHWQEHVMRQ